MNSILIVIVFICAEKKKQGGRCSRKYVLTSFGGRVYVYTIILKQKKRNTLVNSVAKAVVIPFGRGVYVYTIKFKQKTRNPVVYALLTVQNSVIWG